MVFTICAIKRVVVVLPFVPVTAIIGILAELPGGYNMSITGSATFLGKPIAGSICILKPGAAFTSKIAPPFSDTGSDKFSAMISIPQISKPIMRAILSHMKILSG